MSSWFIWACSGLMYSGVPTIWPNASEHCLLGQPLVGRLGHAKVDHLGNGPAVVQRDQHVAGLDVPMDDPLLMSMLDGLANRRKQFQPLPGGQMLIAEVLGDLNPRTSSITK